jgi:hypothetical protein
MVTGVRRRGKARQGVGTDWREVGGARGGGGGGAARFWDGADVVLPPAGFGVVVLWSSVGGSGGERCGEESGAGEVGGRRGNVATRTTWRGAEGARELMAAGPSVRLALAFQSCTTRWTTWTGRVLSC